MTDHLPATQQPTGPVILDWRTHRLSSRRRPCRSCGGLTVLCDQDGRPCHKTCAEAELEATRRWERNRHG